MNFLKLVTVHCIFYTVRNIFGGSKIIMADTDKGQKRQAEADNGTTEEKKLKADTEKVTKPIFENTLFHFSSWT